MLFEVQSRVVANSRMRFFLAYFTMTFRAASHACLTSVQTNLVARTYTIINLLIIKAVTFEAKKRQMEKQIHSSHCFT